MHTNTLSAFAFQGWVLRTYHHTVSPKSRAVLTLMPLITTSTDVVIRFHPVQMWRDANHEHQGADGRALSIRPPSPEVLCPRRRPAPR